MSGVDFERFRQNFADIVENLVGRRIDYTKMYPAVVVAQNSDGTLQVIADDPKIRGNGHNNIALRNGLPGTSVTVQQGSRVRLGFEEGKPNLPYAALWDRNAAFDEINLGQSTEFVALANLVKAELDAMASTFDAHIHITTATVGTGPPGVISPTTTPQSPIGDVAATKVKAE